MLSLKPSSHCSLNPGYKEYEAEDPEDSDGDTFTNEYISVNDSGSKTVNIFQEWLNALRDTLNAELSRKNRIFKRRRRK